MLSSSHGDVGGGGERAGGLRGCRTPRVLEFRAWTSSQWAGAAGLSSIRGCQYDGVDLDQDVFAVAAGRGDDDLQSRPRPVTAASAGSTSAFRGCDAFAPGPVCMLLPMGSWIRQVDSLSVACPEVQRGRGTVKVRCRVGVTGRWWRAF